MKVIQYLTAKEIPLLQNEVFPAVPLSGAMELSRTGASVSEDFLGFGVAITGSSCYNLSQMTPEDRSAFLECIYGREGLGLSVGRISVAASDYSPELYSYDDVAGDVELKHFSIDRDRAYIIPVLQEILRINPELYLFASPWSPPGWMKTGGSLGGGYMRREYLDCYAEYIVRFLQEYAKCGIRISALTPQNEPETDQNGKMPACIWHPDLQAEFAILLRKKLEQNGLDVRIWLYDHNFSGVGSVRWMLDAHRELRHACDGIAFHYYGGAIEDTLPLQEAYPELPLHFTEGGPRLYDHYATDWCKWGTMLSKTLNCGYRSFTGWNLMLDQMGGPNVGPFSCGGLVTRERTAPTSGESERLVESGQYRAFTHFSRFMKKGAVVCAIRQRAAHDGMFSFPDRGTPGVQASCIENADGSLCWFLTNAGEKKAQVQLLEGGQRYYVELLPDSLSTVVMKREPGDAEQ